MLQESERATRELSTKLVIHEEDDEEEKDEMRDEVRSEQIHMGKERVLDVSLQKQKMDIVDQLVGMNKSIRDFSSNVEEKLSAAYRAGNYQKKFGLESASARDPDEDDRLSAKGPDMTTFEKILYKDNKMLNRMQA